MAYKLQNYDFILSEQPLAKNHQPPRLVGGGVFSPDPAGPESLQVELLQSNDHSEVGQVIQEHQAIYWQNPVRL